jgi:HEAT repeat protein
MARVLFARTCMVLALSSLSVGVAAAAPVAKGGTVQPAQVSKWKQALESGSEADKLAALAEISGAPKGAAPVVTGLISELLVRGAGPRVLEAALLVGGQLAQTSLSAAIAPYVRHRQGELRQSAALALAKTGGPEAVSALRAALRSNDRTLRGYAALGLAKLGVKDAVSDLFAVLGKDVPEAAGAIGTLCSPAECRKLFALIGTLPFDTMQSGLEPILLRPETDVPEDVKLELLERLRKLQTKEASAFLQTVRARYPEKGSARIKTALEDAVNNRPVIERSKP